jgi:6-phosphogluconate dehydrogenase (decarboxylating)
MNGQTIGLVGLGTMGRDLALNFRDRGIAVVGHDPSPKAREEFSSAGSGIAYASSACSFPPGRLPPAWCTNCFACSLRVMS